MKKNVILTNFEPIQISKLIDQKKLNDYKKFLYYYCQKDKNKLVFEGSNCDNEISQYDIISEQVDKYAVSAEHINKRQIVLFDEITDFVENEMEFTNLEDYKLPNSFNQDGVDNFGPKLNNRMQWYKEKTSQVFDTFYKNQNVAPENLVHVTCSGYASPSVAQEAVIKRNWETAQVTHSYQMGCYGAFPAIRTASSLLQASQNNGRVDIVHTELLSAHLNLTEFSNSNTMICSLFADGFIGYSLYDEETFGNNNEVSSKGGLKILASHEVIIPDSLEDMSWDLGEYNFLMTLSKRVPVFIRKNIKKFIDDLCEKANVNFDNEKYSMSFAIHPGGPKIIDYVVDELEIFKEQAGWSYEVLRRHGNMSSATVPHIFKEILNDDNITKGTKIVAMAFGPGLTATALLVEKV
ncbi:MAG: 3-oxoacyl-[acyl-carrier-protein] synthase III C-terminal domain-containing protein [Limnohabitans sp.]|nr:3-oxoacyl-[acyl-carrier-protein] synthase III C-terminal domain-containing protein [Limnohabitans sp.]